MATPNAASVSTQQRHENTEPEDNRRSTHENGAERRSLISHAARASRAPATSAGFSLMELLVVLTITAVLMGLALPSFIESLRANRLASTTNLTLATLAYARNEALRAKAGSTVCPRGADGSSCGKDWNAGLLVWTDDDRDQTFDAAELRRTLEPSGDIAISAANVDRIAFDHQGRSTSTTPRSLRLQPDPCTPGQYQVRSISVGAIGQASVSKETCP
ncbi:GspH/FimT family pseudopilin [Lysobacter sp. cf310]|uniref:GspH/FimT family pseudopilin n=1 Tax=Lysobacter sp. cf310 TaxID=1761790 RepID=UPI0008EC9992|nr:GspH/FimT family pseudopilin [Lysobacter sp. cf310]SFK32163.1 type IV fimbrial biogenesis protein FimT [Lysobacter sp. cf310]